MCTKAKTTYPLSRRTPYSECPRCPRPSPPAHRPADSSERIGFSPPPRISYRGVKLPRVSAVLGRLDLRRGADLPQACVRYSASVIVSVIGVPTAPCGWILRCRRTVCRGGGVVTVGAVRVVVRVIVIGVRQYGAKRE